MTSDGQIIHCVNTYAPGIGVIAKRPGYGTFLNNPDNSQVNTIKSWSWADGTTLFLYRASGSQLYYSQQGTANWTPAGNGTLGSGSSHWGAVNLNGVYIGGDGMGSTRHTTDGMNFTTTVGAPVGQFWETYQNAAFVGAGSVLFQSCSNDATNWTIGGTSDSTSFDFTAEGAIGVLFKVNDYLIISKNRRTMFQYDGNAFVDLATNHGPSSPYCIGSVSGQCLYLNQIGHFSFDGATPQLLSNAVQRQFYNRADTGMAGTVFFSTPGVGHIYDYFAYQGTITDDFTGRTIPNAILKYDYQKNQYMNWSFANAPTAFHSFTDKNGRVRLLFGDANGNTYRLENDKLSDNGVAIQSEVVMLFTYASQGQDISSTSAQTTLGSTWEKKWNWIRLFFNKGDECNIQYAFSNTLTYQHLRWSEAINVRANGQPGGDYFQVSDGVAELRFPMTENNVPRSRFLFLRIYDDSDSSAWTYLGAQIDAEPIEIK